jgi:hypothetical protein
MPASDWADMCTETVVWEPKTGRDQYGKPTYGTAQTFTGRRQYKLVRTGGSSQGAIPGGAPEVNSRSQIIILGYPNIGYEDRVYIQGDTEPFPPIVDIEKPKDENGGHHVKVYLGGANG